MEGEPAVICTRVGDPHHRDIPGTVERECSLCKHPVYASPSTLETGMRIVCLECAHERWLSKGHVPTIVQTPSQVREIMGILGPIRFTCELCRSENSIESGFDENLRPVVPPPGAASFCTSCGAIVIIDASADALSAHLASVIELQDYERKVSEEVFLRTIATSGSIRSRWLKARLGYRCRCSSEHFFLPIPRQTLPGPGDVLVCKECATISYITDDFRGRRGTDEDVRKLKSKPELLYAVTQLQKKVRLH